MVIKLINGRGQVGSKLEEKLKSFPYTNSIQNRSAELAGDGRYTYIYHTWNIDDKTEPTQLIEYQKFKKFVDQHNQDRIVFISTYDHARFSPYIKYKTMAESYVMEHNTNKYHIIRLPQIIGKGAFDYFKDCLKSNKPPQVYGDMEIIGLDEVCNKILDQVMQNNYPALTRIKGDLVNPNTVIALLKYGSDLKSELYSDSPTKIQRIREPNSPKETPNKDYLWYDP